MATPTGVTRHTQASATTTRQPEFHPTRRGPRRTWGGYLAAAWATAYLLLMHLPIVILRHPLLPWPDDPRPGATMPSGLTESAVILMLVGAVGVGLALVRPWGRAVPRWLLLGTAWTGCGIGVAHWAIWSVQALLRLVNGFDVPPPAGVTVGAWQTYAHDMDVLNLALYEPWFLCMGLFLGLAAWQNIRRARDLARSVEHDGRRRASAPPPPAWMIKNGWPNTVLVPWAIVATGVQMYWALTLDQAWMQVGCVIGALLSMGGALLGQLVKRDLALHPTRILAGGLTLGGLAVTLFGIMSFAPWVFAFYGPGLMAGGLLLELAGWPSRLRLDAEATDR